MERKTRKIKPPGPSIRFDFDLLKADLTFRKFSSFFILIKYFVKDLTYYPIKLGRGVTLRFFLFSKYYK